MNFEEYYPNPDEDFERELKESLELRRKKIEKSVSGEWPKNHAYAAPTNQVRTQNALQAALRALEANTKKKKKLLLINPRRGLAF